MGRFLIWLSGAHWPILKECPAEQPKYVGIGASILITATMAAVSLAFALVTALKAAWWVAMPFAVAWGLAILSLDRLFVVSLPRKGTRRAQLLRAAPRVLLALLLGFVISTPFVLQIFRPEIEHEITQLQDQAAVAYFNSLRASPLSKEITNREQQVATLQAEAAGTGAGTTPTQSPALARLERQRSDLVTKQNTALSKYHCELYGPCQPTGNGPVAQKYNAQYQADGSQIDALTTQINRLQQQQQAATQKQESLLSGTASSQLATAKSALNADIAEQQRETDAFVARNKGDTGLLIRLQALDAITSHDSTLNAARWLVFLLFVIIDCMPVMIKVMLNLGPVNNYDLLLEAEEHEQRCVAANDTALRLTTEMLAAGTVIGTRSWLAGWSAPLPELPQKIISARTAVAAEKVEAWKDASIRRLRNGHAAAHGPATGSLTGSVLTGAAAPPWRWWRRRRHGGPREPDGASPPRGTPPPTGPGKPDHSGDPEPPRDGKSTPAKARKWLSCLVTVLAIPLVIAAVGWRLSVQQNHLADQQHNNDVEAAYLSAMHDLLFNQSLRSAPSDSDIHTVAVEKTVTTLQQLDAPHNADVLRFLRDVGLIGAQHEVIDLNGADLNGADLRNVNLAGVTMDGANLAGAHLSGATLTGASLSDAILTGADLTGARLGGAILSSADLSGAHLGRAILSGADLIGAKNPSQQQFNQVSSCPSLLPAKVTCDRAPVVTLTYWLTESGKEKDFITHTVIPQFEKKYPRIRINPVAKNFFDTRAAFTAAAQGGQAPGNPDVLRSDLSWTGEFAKQGYLLNIDPYVYQDQSTLDLQDYQKVNPPLGPDLRPAGNKVSPLTYVTYGNHLYGLPEVTDVLALLYNKKELKEAGITPPRTMAGFKTAVAEVVQKKKATYGFETDGTFNKALPFLYACGGGLLDQHSNNILLNDPGSVSGLDFLLHLNNQGSVRPMHVNLTNGAAISPIVTDFRAGKTAMIFDGPYDTTQILKGSSFKSDHNNLGIAAIPGGAGGRAGSPSAGSPTSSPPARPTLPKRSSS